MKKNTEQKTSKTSVYLEFIAKKTLLVVFDAVISYLAFYFALVIRFFANGNFLEDARPYLSIFHRFSPYFAGITVIGEKQLLRQPYREIRFG